MITRQQQWLEGERFPPHMQQSILRLLIHEPRLVGVLKEHMQPAFFLAEEGGHYHSAVCEIIYAYYDQYSLNLPRSAYQLETQRVIGSRPAQEQAIFADQFKALELEMYGDVVYNDEEYVRTHVTRWIREQALKLVVISMKDSIESSQEFDYDKHLADIRDVAGLDFDKEDDDVTLMRDVELSMQALYRSMMIERISLSYQPLDEVMTGGIATGEMLLFEGPPNRGKSTILCAMTAGLLKSSANVVHITLEQDKRAIFAKITSNLSGIPPKQFEDRRAEIQTTYDFFRRATTSKLRVKQYPEVSLSVAELRAYLSEVKQEWQGELDAVVLDYPDLMKLGAGPDANHEKLATLYRALRGLANEMGFSIVTATQTNRAAATKERISMQDLSACFAKAEIADVILAICQTEAEYENQQMRLYVAKNRLGPKHMEIPFKVNFELARINHEPALKQMQSRPNTQAIAQLGMNNAGSPVSTGSPVSAPASSPPPPQLRPVVD